MLRFFDLLSFPISLKDRNKTWKELKTKLLDISKLENSVVFYGLTNDYQQIIFLENNKIHIYAKVRIYCSCESFKYEFAYNLNRYNSLYKPDRFRKVLKYSPSKNLNIVSGCKHCIAFANYLKQQSNQINQRL